jgi:hypothetical protein
MHVMLARALSNSRARRPEQGVVLRGTSIAKHTEAARSVRTDADVERSDVFRLLRCARDSKRNADSKVRQRHCGRVCCGGSACREYRA